MADEPNIKVEGAKRPRIVFEPPGQPTGQPSAKQPKQLMLEDVIDDLQVIQSKIDAVSLALASAMHSLLAIALCAA